MLLAIEIFFMGMLVLASAAIAAVSALVIYKLFKGQR
jgi:hypothetical protein